VPLVGIPYDPKVSRFLQAIGLPAVFNVEQLDYDELSAGIKSVLADWDRISAGLKEKIAAQRAGALKNALMAAELFRSG
jgi:polysaccharide pyruvyl transferase WcaK-like protein